MAHNLKLAERIQAEFAGVPFVEKKMFGGVGFLSGGNTPALPGTAHGLLGKPGRCAPGASVGCGVHNEDLIVRVDPAKHEKLLRKPSAKVFDITGKPMKGWLMVEPEGSRTKKPLGTWVKEGIEFALTLTPK